ncbi:MAG: preprotein translocase subunit SecE [Chthonomonadaceae bacterium]|nr:preprotein translocase subunit SecE [Chthonomonadaceae bacterium]
MAVEQTRGTASNEPNATPRSGNKYFQETMTELKKTTWPTKQEATRLTGIVVGVIIVLGTYMAILDGVLSALVSKFSLIK